MTALCGVGGSGGGAGWSWRATDRVGRVGRLIVSRSIRRPLGGERGPMKRTRVKGKQIVQLPLAVEATKDDQGSTVRR